MPINNTPRRGATVATPITPIVTHVSLYTNTHVYTRGSDSPLKLLRRRERKLRTDPFPPLFLSSFSGNCRAESRKGRKVEVTIFRCTFLGENWGPVNCTRKRMPTCFSAGREANEGIETGRTEERCVIIRKEKTRGYIYSFVY